MGTTGHYPPAMQPEDLSRFLVERVNAGDVDGCVALYEPVAVLAFPPGQVAAGSDAIRTAFADFIGSGAKLRPSSPRPTLQAGDLALTSTASEGGVSVEVARRQADGTWRWVIDQPNVVD